MSRMDAEASHKARVKDYFDQDSGRYESHRYSSDYTDCHQFSYLVRRSVVLDLLPTGGNHILDVGCGPGIYTRSLLDRGFRVWACDISTMMIERARAEFGRESDCGMVRFHTGEIHELEVDNHFFDAAICIGVVSYIPDLDRFLSRLSALIRPGGCVVIQISKRYSPKSFDEQIAYPFLSSVKHLFRAQNKTDGWDFRLRRYTVKEFNCLCAAHGLDSEEEVHFNYTLPFLSVLAKSLNLRLARSLEKRGGKHWHSVLAGDYVARYRKAESGDNSP